MAGCHLVQTVGQEDDHRSDRRAGVRPAHRRYVRLALAGINVNLIVVSDHGMVQTSNERVIFIDDYTDTSEVRIIDWSPLFQLWPKPGKEEAVYRRMTGAHPRLQVYRAAEIPDRLHYRNHRRIAPIIALAEEGWSITTRSSHRSSSGGNHGYDNALESMQAISLARGPAFRQGIVVDPVENIHNNIIKVKP
ncbi:MAG: alkaline phosphatase family protein [Bacteroidota bacterium]